MKSLHVIPEIPLVIIYDRQKRSVESFEISMQSMYDLKRKLGDALSQAFPLGLPPKNTPPE
jgi:hypothetical protein